MPNNDTPHRNRKWVLEQWTQDVVVASWLRWHEKISVHQAQLVHALLQNCAATAGEQVLDLGCGPGAVALSLSETVGTDGEVVTTDISPGIVESLKDRAAALDVENIDVVVAESEELPFDSEQFDLVTSLLTPMYFVTVSRSFAEIRRVLRGDGRVCLMAWGMPEQGDYFETCVLPFLQRSNLDAPPPEAPSPFRFAPPGLMTGELVKAGFVDVTERRFVLPMSWPGSPEELWRHLYETCVGFRPIFDSLSRDRFEEAYAESMASLAGRYDGTSTVNSVEIVLGIGRKV